MNFQDLKSKKIANVALHLLVWGFWFAAPIFFLFNNPHKGGPPVSDFFFFAMWTSMFFSVGLFYLNYFVLIDRFLFNKKLIWFLTINFLLILFFSFLLEMVKELSNLFFLFKDPNPEPIRGWVEILFGRHIFTYFFVISISVAIRTTSRWYSSETQRRNLENEHLRSELSNLKNQLNPHFFFNTLNNIYSLIRISPEKAQESVHGLAKLMRYHLYETDAEKVPLNGEVDFLKNYLALMELRIAQNVRVESHFFIENQSSQIAPLLFIPLVENTFKHGMHPVEKSLIRIILEEKDHVLTFESFNTNHPQSNSENDKSGIGLENIKKRLSLIYPNDHLFRTEMVDNTFHVKVVIKL